MNFASNVLDALNAVESQYSFDFVESMEAGLVSKNRLRRLAVQIYLQEKWPSHVANVYLQLDEMALECSDIIDYVISLIKAENLGVGSGGLSHARLARRFAGFVGVTDQALRRATPTIENRALMDWCDLSELNRPWLEALAVQVACESHVNSMARIGKALQKHYGATKDEAMIWLIHGGRLEKKHKKDGLALLEKYTRKTDLKGVIHAYSMTCRLTKELYDAI